MHISVANVSVCCRSSITSVKNDVTKTLNKLDNVAADEANLEAKIEKRKVKNYDVAIRG